VQKSITEVDKRLLVLSNKKIKKSDSINRIGLAVPKVRAELKKDLSFIGGTQSETLQYWDKVWKESSYFESMSLALYYYQHKNLSKSEFTKLKTWVDRCTCWEHSDDLSKIYAQVLEGNPNWVLPIYRKWNKSKCTWKKRQSVVGLLEYASKRKKTLSFNDLISFVNPLLSDEEYYVQKGIGWTLREIYNVYPEKALNYIQKNLFNISPNAYSAATEKIDKNIKKEMNDRRKRNRKTCNVST
jgi:3-methyladenine DNA glycosylase AlkD